MNPFINSKTEADEYMYDHVRIRCWDQVHSREGSLGCVLSPQRRWVGAYEVTVCTQRRRAHPNPFDGTLSWFWFIFNDKFQFVLKVVIVVGIYYILWTCLQRESALKKKLGEFIYSNPSSVQTTPGAGTNLASSLCLPNEISGSILITQQEN